MSCMEPTLKKQKMSSTDKALRESPGVANLPSAQELEEMCMSPDPFEDSFPQINISPEKETRTKMSEKMPRESGDLREVICIDAKRSSTNVEVGGGESSNASKNIDESIPWRGCSIQELQKGPNEYGMPQLHPIKPCSTHSVMFQIGPAKKEGPESSTDAWDSNHVRLPCSPQNKYPVGDTVKSRWDMVKAALQKPIQNSQELEATIMSYNNKYLGRWDFSGLHYFFNEAIEEEETLFFFSNLLPQIAELALQLPALITRPLPLLRKGQNHSISLTQQQVACLLANAFFCTFPRRNAARKASEYATFPDINFNRLFQSHKKKGYLQRVSEKLKCIFHYFRRVCVTRPTGTITFTRKFIPIGGIPSWDNSGHFFRKLHISSSGTIESCGRGMLQMDFANKMVGGGVLGWGCVQEEIRFVICPELIIARLFTECLDATEALLITGCEQYSTYEGYADNFTWAGDYQDNTPRDSSGRMLCSVIAIDALYLRYPSQQFIVTNLSREINKAYAGFHNQEVNPEHISAVATGNWGCGVYRGNTRLKALLQLMAATQTGRALAYFTFGDDELRDDVAQMHTFLVEHKATVGLVWRHLSRYYDQCYRSGIFNQELYDFIYKSIDPAYSRKGRHTTAWSPSKIKTFYSQSGKIKPSAFLYKKGNPDQSGGSSSHHEESPDKSRKHSPACSSESEIMKHTETSPSEESPSKSEPCSPPASFSQTGKMKRSESLHCKRSPEKSRKASSPVSPSKPSTSGDHARLTTARSGQVKSPCTSPTASKNQRPGSRSSKNPFRKTNLTPTKKVQSKYLDKKSWKRSIFSSHTTDLQKIDLPGNQTSIRSSSPTGNISPIRSFSPIKHHSSPPKSASLDFEKNNDIGGDEFGRSGFDGLWSDTYEKPRPLTIQKRISDYFYELNVPK